MYLRPWLHRIGLSEADVVEYCQFYALVAHFPGNNKAGHLKPPPQQILEHRPVLLQMLQTFQPEVIVPVGTMAISELLPGVTGKLSDIVGHSYRANPFNSLIEPIPAVPLPHPSGRSTWVNQHKDLVELALTELQKTIITS